MTIFGQAQSVKNTQTLLVTAGTNKVISGNLRICNNGFVADYLAQNLTDSGKEVASNTGSPVGLFVGDSGTKLFQSDLTANTISMFVLNTPYDIESKEPIASKTLDVSAQTTNPQSIWMDASHLFIACDDASTKVISYDMSVDWDIDTAVYNSSFDVNAQEATLASIFVKPDGTKFYIMGSGSDTIYQYSMGTAFTPSSASYDSESYTQSDDGTPYHLSFSSDGKTVYYAGNATTTLYQRYLNVAWDISTASERSVDGDYVESFALGVSNFKDLFIAPEANKVIVLQSTGGGALTELNYSAPETTCRAYKQSSGSSLPASRIEQDLNVVVASGDTFVDAASRVLNDGERLIVESTTGSAIFSFEGVEETV